MSTKVFTVRMSTDLFDQMEAARSGNRNAFVISAVEAALGGSSEGQPPAPPRASEDPVPHVTTATGKPVSRADLFRAAQKRSDAR